MAKQEIVRRQDGATATVEQALARVLPQIRSVLPSHLTPERLARIAVGAIDRSAQLRSCTPQSLVRCVLEAAALGIEIGDGTQRAYLVPRGTEATLVISYRGLLDLAWRSGRIESISVHEVYKGDDFQCSFGLEERLVHVPGGGSDPASITHVYAVIRLAGGGRYVEVMTRAQIDAIRARSQTGRQGPWSTDYAMMSRKTVLRRALRYVPSSTEVQRAVTVDEAHDLGHPYESIVQMDDEPGPDPIAALRGDEPPALPEGDREPGEEG